MLLRTLLWLIAGFLPGATDNDGLFHLTNFQWRFQSANGSFQGSAHVPGDIYQDLFIAKYIPAPLFGDNDDFLRWVPRMDWIYYTTFIIPESWSNVKAVLLNAQGLDTVADVFFNDALVLKAHNQFIPYLILLKGWRIGANNLRIVFKSPVNYAAMKSKEYQEQFGHIVPPACPVPDFRGECHVNFMRKIQASFSWDWGPSFPTVGIWEPISIEGVQTFFMDKISAVVSFENQRFIVSARITIWSAVKANLLQARIAIPEISIMDRFTISLNPMSRNIVERKIIIPSHMVEWWWPNGSGKQKLYDLIAAVYYKGQEYHSKRTRVGFRTVELIQDYINHDHPEFGRHFFFKINGRSLFLKGSNWIPLSVFPARNHRFREQFLLESAREANMNALRVWGGGRYESDRFYDLADELGILIWQDMMFACALYPVDKHYLNSVRGEVYAQVERLRHHPSIFVWAGNNENELGLNSWWYAENYSVADTKADYMKLYNETIRPIIAKLDGTRPYLLSSPTNGIESEKEGGVAKNPGDERYGDIHFYNEFKNLWADSTYQIPRCSSEYGVQSFPRKETMLKWLHETDWFYTNKRMVHRQHHPGGYFAQLSMIFSHFKIPNECGEKVNDKCNYVRTKSFMDRFVYLSQFHQAIAYQVQTEHYRRWRGRLTRNGYGNTMCALYWQLNDLWAAPTWSTIDFELSWKPAHYFARRFFAPVILSMVVDGDVKLFIVSDLIKPLSDVKVVVDVYLWLSNFSPVQTFQRYIGSIPPQSSTRIPVDVRIIDIIKGIRNGVYVLRGRIFSSNGTQIGYDTVHLPDKLFKIDEMNFGKAWIQNLRRKNARLYELELEADKIAPLVYLELAPGFVGWFSDNAFTMTEPRKTVLLTLFKKPEFQLTKNDITICSLRNCGKPDK